MKDRPLKYPECVHWTLRTSALDQDIKEQLMVTATAVWPYARSLARSYLQDESMAMELLEKAMMVVQGYATRQGVPPATGKLTARARSQVRRVVKQHAGRKRHEESRGSMSDLEGQGGCRQPDPTEALFLIEFFRRLTPKGRRIAHALQSGMTWREIAAEFKLDHSTVRRTFRREADAILHRTGDEADEVKNQASIKLHHRRNSLCIQR